MKFENYNKVLIKIENYNKTLIKMEGNFIHGTPYRVHYKNNIQVYMQSS